MLEAWYSLFLQQSRAGRYDYGSRGWLFASDSFQWGLCRDCAVARPHGTIISVYADSAETFLTVGQIILHRECLNT